MFVILSTFGGNPLASAVAIASLDVIKDEGLAERYCIISIKISKFFEEELILYKWLVFVIEIIRKLEDIEACTNSDLILVLRKFNRFVC